MYQIISILTPMVKPNQMYWEEGILVCRMKELLDNSVCIYVYMCVCMYVFYPLTMLDYLLIQNSRSKEMVFPRRQVREREGEWREKRRGSERRKAFYLLVVHRRSILLARGVTVRFPID